MVFLQRISSRVLHRTSYCTVAQYKSTDPFVKLKHGSHDELILFHKKPFVCQYGGVLPELHVAFESWGKLNEQRDNTILLMHGLSASQHARSKLDCSKSKKGWWEKFIGPGLSLDTDRFHVVCVNLLGSCYGTTGPSSKNPETGKEYGGSFPIVSVADMVHSQFLLLDKLNIHKIFAVVGSSLGGLLSFMSAALYGSQVQRMVSISSGGSAVASAIAFRYLQRVALMSDPHWDEGNYYGKSFPTKGTQLARKIATLTYRSGPEWTERFHTKKISNPTVKLPRYDGCEFQIEDYIRHQGVTFASSKNYDPNSLIYLSKAMDIFDIGEGFNSMQEGFSRIKCPSLILGVTSDILYPSVKQVEAAKMISDSGNKNVTLKITEGKFGHDTFLLDVDGMGKDIKEFLEA